MAPTKASPASPECTSISSPTKQVSLMPFSNSVARSPCYDKWRKSRTCPGTTTNPEAVHITCTLTHFRTYVLPQSRLYALRNYALTQLRTYALTHLRIYALTHSRTYAITPFRIYAPTPLRTYAFTHLRTYALTQLRNSALRTVPCPLL
jgi:hypothetical protein